MTALIIATVAAWAFTYPALRYTFNDNIATLACVVGPLLTILCTLVARLTWMLSSWLLVAF